MQPSQEEVNNIFREKVLRSRSLSISERFRLSIEMCELVWEMQIDSLRNEYPEAGEEEIKKIMRERVERKQQWVEDK